MNKSRKQSTAAAIGDLIKQLRRERHMTGAQLAERSKLSQPTISRIEHGQGTFDAAKVALLVDILEPSQTIQQQIASLLTTQGQSVVLVQPDYLFRYDSFEKLITTVQSSTTIDMFLLYAMPIYLQTPDYRHALLGQIGNDEQLRISAMQTLPTLQDFLWDKSKSFTFIVPESVLYTIVTPIAQHLVQLDRLERMLSWEGIEFGVIPLESGLSVVAPCTFVLYDQKLLRREIGDSMLETDDPAVVAHHKRLFADLSKKALFGQDAIPLVRKAYAYFDAK